MAEFGFKKTADGFEFKGHINESAVFPAVDVTRSPLLLNFRQVSGINSIGVQKYLAFVDAWNGRPVEYHQVPIALVDAFVMLPALLGPEENTVRLKSFQVPFSCDRCRDSVALIVTDKDLTKKDDQVVLPPRACPRCSTFLKAGDIVQDYIVFFEAGAIKDAK